MTRAALMALLGTTAMVLQGCPVFPDDPRGCTSDSQCPSGYFCELGSAVCSQPAQNRICRAPDECGVREVCGDDGRCHVGSCSLSGCVSGYACEAVGGVWQCVASGGAAGASGGGAAGASGGGVAGASGGTAGSAGSAGAAP
jgi:Cys-rich repeat protein